MTTPTIFAINLAAAVALWSGAGYAQSVSHNVGICPGNTYNNNYSCSLNCGTYYQGYAAGCGGWWRWCKTECPPWKSPRHSNPSPLDSVAWMWFSSYTISGERMDPESLREPLRQVLEAFQENPDLLIGPGATVVVVTPEFDDIVTIYRDEEPDPERDRDLAGRADDNLVHVAIEMPDDAWREFLNSSARNSEVLLDQAIAVTALRAGRR